MTINRILALRIASALFVTACGSSATGVDAGTLTGSFALEQVDGTPLPLVTGKIVSVVPAGGPTTTCTAYLTAMSIDVTSSGDAARRESSRLTCDDGRPDQTSTFTESGKASRTGDEWRFDFTRTDVALTTHYLGRSDGSTLTIARRETDPVTVGQVLIPATVDLSQLVFLRL